MKDSTAADHGPEELAEELEGEIPAVEGTTGSRSSFFDAKHAAAVHKHAILHRYLPKFFAKTGKDATGKRVVYLDGYAGPGRYNDGADGSPALAVRLARDLSTLRKIECVFIEKNRSDYDLLRSFIDKEADGLSIFLHNGKVEDYLRPAIDLASGVPLFAFLDPYGLSIPYRRLVDDVLLRPGPSHGAQTEVLLNFSADAVRRIGGLLRQQMPNRRAQSALQSMDIFCGGSWWREKHQTAGSDERAVTAIAREFVRKVEIDTSGMTGGGYTGRLIPVRNRRHHQPIYMLVHFTRHRDGRWFFNEAAGMAARDWRKFTAPPETGQSTLWGTEEDSLAVEEASREEEWVAEITRNLRYLARERQPFTLGDRDYQVLGDAYGQAWTKHVRKALMNLNSEGLLVHTPKGKADLQNYYFQPAS